MRHALKLAAFAIAALALYPAAWAAEFPSRPVTLIVPFPPGGSTDQHLRALAEATSKHLGQPITIENKPGATGTLGPATMAAAAKPDGYTLSQLPITTLRLPYMQKTAFDPKTDFTPILLVTGYTFTVSVRADAPWKTWKEFLTDAKANPGKIRYSSSGTGGSLHITMEQIAQQQGIKWVHVPFRGEAEQTAALLGGHTEASAAGMQTAQLVEAGQVRTLVVWTEQRAPRLPDVPTLLEEGHGIVSASPYGIAGPKGMDPKIVKILHDAFKKGMEEPSHVAALERLSQPAMYKNTEDYKKYILDTIAEQQAMIQKLGLGEKK